MLEDLEELIGVFIYKHKNIGELFIPLNSKFKNCINYKYNKEPDLFKIELKEENSNQIYGKNINLTALIGENGSGKSNITSALASILREPYKNEDEDYFIPELPEKYCLIFKVEPNEANKENCYRYKTNIKNCEILINDIPAFKKEEQYYCAMFRPYLLREDDDFPLEFPIENKWYDTLQRKIKNYFYYDRYRSYETSHSLRDLFAHNKTSPLYLFQNELSYLFFDTQTREMNLEKRIIWLKQRFNKITKTYYRPDTWKNKDFWDFSDNVNFLLDKRKELTKKGEYLNFSNFANGAFPILCLTFFYIQLGFLFSKLEGSGKIISGEILNEGRFIIGKNAFNHDNMHLEFSKYYQKIKKEIKKAEKDFEIKKRLEKDGFLEYFYSLLNSYIKIEKELFAGKNPFENILETPDGNLFRLKNMTPVNNKESEEMKFLDNLGVFEINYYKKKNGEFYSFTSLSTGEQHILRFFADFFAAVKETNIFILDETDLSLHPEWQRKFISIILDIAKIENKRINIILTTHSPIILSDLTTNSVVLLKKVKDKNNKNLFDTEIANHETKTFGTNIHSLFAHPFFMKSTIGDFAETKIKEVVQIFHEDKLSDKNLKKAEEIIELLDKSVQKNILLTMKYKYKQRLDNEKNNK